MAHVALRPYQHEAVDAVLNAEQRGITRPLVALPTGAGKTIVAAELIRRRGGTTLFLAHRDELLRQAADKITMVMPELALGIGLVKATRDDTGARVVIGSVQTLAHKSRLAGLPRHFDTVICDEAHRSAADGYVRIFEHLSDCPLRVGLTATPERNDKRHLADVWDEVVYRKTLPEMIAAGYLCDLRAVHVALDVDLDDVAQSNGDFQAGALGRALEQANAPGHISRAYREHASGRKALLFAPTVDLAHAMAARLSADGVPAEAVDAGTPGEQRRDVLARFRDGDVQVLSSVDIFTEGYDEPSIACVILARPTRSRIRFSQAIGRGCRIHPGKDDCLVLDVTGATKRLSLVGLPRLFGLSKEPERGETVMQALVREHAEKDAVPAPDAQGRLVVEVVDLFKDKSKRQRLHWLRIGERYVLSLGKDSLELAPRGNDQWAVLHVVKGSERQLATGVDLSYAHGIAEDHVRAAGAGALVDPNAGWRKVQAGPKQLDLLKRLGVDVPEGTSKGDASDMISTALAAKRARGRRPKETGATASLVVR